MGINLVDELVDFVQNAIEGRLVDVHTAMPGEIYSYNAATQTAQVQPCIKRVYIQDSKAVPLPIVSNVPVVFPSADAGTAILTFPVKKGDPCLLIFSERALEQWYQKGGVVDPQDTRKFALSDAYCLMGGLPKPKKSSRATTNSVRLEYKDAKIELFPDGRITMGDGSAKLEITSAGKVKFGVGSTDVLQILSDTLQAITQISVAYSDTPSSGPDVRKTSGTGAAIATPGPVNAATFASLKSQLDGIKG